ncbi:hypothetical protein ACIPW5_23725 [Streptomyces sp. NPDC090077]|uniref:hypothetical protein n=1 Tax=Streptomyces sp. NPDC090077 TaxID=3365938 RepID=UPI0037F50B1D
MPHVLDAPGGLTDRARRFLSARGRAVPFPTVENPDDAQVAERLARFPGVDKDVFLARLRPARHTEWWWESDGFRVHVWHTFAELFEQDRLAKWGLWARDEAGVRAAHRFLAGLPARVDGTS